MSGLLTKFQQLYLHDQAYSISPQRIGVSKPRGSQTDLQNRVKLSRVLHICKQLVTRNPIEAFAINCEQTICSWIALLRESTLPENVRSSDPRFLRAFKYVDAVITGKHGTHLLRRLAFVQLMRIFQRLEASIKNDRRTGCIEREPCYRHTSVAIDIYTKAQNNPSERSRRVLKDRKRSGRSWTVLAGHSPLFALVYAEAADLFVFDTIVPL